MKENTQVHMPPVLFRRDGTPPPGPVAKKTVPSAPDLEHWEKFIKLAHRGGAFDSGDLSQ
jgi:hypothetical protein